MNRRSDHKPTKVITAKLWRFALGQHFVNDIETGAFEVADDILPATNRLFERFPDAQPWIVLGIEQLIDSVHVASKKLYDSRRSK